MGGIFQKLMANPQAQASAIQSFSSLDLSSPRFQTLSGQVKWDEIASAIGSTDERLMGYLQTLQQTNGAIDNSSASTRGFSQYLIQTGQAYNFAAIQAALLNTALNAGIMLAVVAQIKLLSNAWDYFNVTVAETEEEIGEVSARLNEFNTEYETLSAKNPDSLSEAEQERLNYLTDRIDKEKELLELLKAKSAQEEIGGKFTDLFDEDSFSQKLFLEKWRVISPLELIFGDVSDNFNVLSIKTANTISYYNDLKRIINDYKEQMESLPKNSDFYDIAALSFKVSKKKLEDYDSSTMQNQLLHWKEKRLEYMDAIAQLEEHAQNPNIPSDSQEEAQKKKNEYQYILKIAENYIKQLTDILNSPQLLAKSLDKRLANLTAQNLNDYFTDKEIKQLSEMTLHENATIRDLKVLLTRTPGEINKTDSTDTTNSLSFTEAFHSEEFKETREELLQLARAGRLTAETFQEASGAENFLTGIGMSAEEATEQVLSTLSAHDKLEVYASQLRTLKSIYEDFDSSGFVSAADLDTMEEFFGSFESFHKFSEIASDVHCDAGQIEDAFNNIAMEALIVSGSLDNLNQGTRDSIVRQLELQGVSNASGLITERMAEVLGEAAARQMSLADAADFAARGLLSESELAGQTGRSIYALAAAEISYNRSGLDTNGKIQALKELANTYGDVTTQALAANAILAAEASAKNIMRYQPGNYPEIYQKEKEKKLQEVQNSIRKFTENMPDIGASSSKRNNLKTPSSVGGSSSKSVPVPQTYDWVEKKLSHITKETEQARKAFEKAFTPKSTLEKFHVYLSKISAELAANREAAWAYQQKLNSIGLSPEWIEKIQNGAYAIEDVTDETLKKQISAYEAYYAKRSKCDEDYFALEEKKTQAQKSYADRVAAFHDKEISATERAIAANKALADLKEAFGKNVSERSLKGRQDNYAKGLSILAAQDARLKTLQNSVEKGTDAWNAFQEQIEKNREKSQEFTKAIADLAAEIANLPLDKLDRYLEKSNAKSELYEAKISNLVKAGRKNQLVSKQIKIVQQNNDKTQKAAQETKQNYKDSVLRLKPARDKDTKGLSKSAKKQADNYYQKLQRHVKKKEPVPPSLLRDIASAGLSELQQAAAGYNAALAANETAQETAKLTAETSRKETAGLSLKKFQNLKDSHERKSNRLKERTDVLSASLDLSEAGGRLSSRGHYNALASLEKKHQKSLAKERKELQTQLDQAVASGQVKKLSEEWEEMAGAIHEVDLALAQSQKNLLEYRNQMRQAGFDQFDYLQDQISRLHTEADFYLDTMANRPLTDDAGLTKHGAASMGLHYQKSEIYEEQAKRYAGEIKKISSMLAEDPANTTLLSQMQEYQDIQRECIKNARQERQAMADLAKQGYEALIRSLDKSVGKYKELLQSAKDAHSYQKDVARQAKDITKLKKQASAYASLTGSEENAAKLQRLQDSLANAEDNLSETLYDKYLSDTQDAMDDLVNELEEFLEELEQDSDKLVEEGIRLVTTSTDGIRATLEELSGESGIALSDAMTSSWGSYKNAAGGINAILQAIEKLQKNTDKENQRQAYDTASGIYAAYASYDPLIQKADKKQDSLKKDRDEAKEKRDKAKKKLQEAEKKHGKDSTQYKKADKSYQAAKKNYQEIDSDYQAAKKKVTELKAQKDSSKGSAKNAVWDYLLSTTGTEKPKKITSIDQAIKALTGGYLDADGKKQLFKLLGAKNQKQALKSLEELGLYDPGKNNGKENQKEPEKNDSANNSKNDGSSEKPPLRKPDENSAQQENPKKKFDTKRQEGIPKNHVSLIDSGSQERRKSDLLTEVAPARKKEPLLELKRNEQASSLKSYTLIDQSSPKLLLQGMASKTPIPEDFLMKNIFTKDLAFRDFQAAPVSITTGDLYLPSVSDPSEFAEGLVHALQQDATVQKTLGTFINASLTGGNSLSIRKY